MVKTDTHAWNAADGLDSREDMAAYLEAAFEDGDPTLIAAALGDIARAKGMTTIARQAGLGRESLYRSLSSEGNPELATVLRVVDALGLRLQAVPKLGTSTRPDDTRGEAPVPLPAEGSGAPRQRSPRP